MFRVMFFFSALGSTVDTRPCVSHGSFLLNYTHFLREDGRGRTFHVPLASGSHLSVSASPELEELRKTGLVGDDLTKMFPYTALCLVRGGYTLMRQFTEAAWTNFPRFPA